MPRNGSGSFSLAQSPFVAGTTISSAAMNSDLSDIATALTGSLPRDGQAGMTGQLKLPDGNALAPGFSFSNETNTGFTRVSAGVIGITILGVQVGTITATGITGGIPVGAITDFAGPAAPVGWILCFGQAVSRATFAALFAVIGATYGSGDGSTTFNLPDCRGYAVVGNDHMGGVSSGRVPAALTNNGGVAGNQNTSLIMANVPSHTHTVSGTTGTENQTHTHNTASIPTIAGNNNNNGGGGGSFAAMAGTGIFASGTELANHNHNFAVTSDGGSGSNTAFLTLTPSLALNKIIYTGG